MSDTILLIEARQMAEPVVRGYRHNDNWDIREALIAFGEEYINRLIAKGELRRVVPVSTGDDMCCPQCGEYLWYEDGYGEKVLFAMSFCTGCGNPIKHDHEH